MTNPLVLAAAMLAPQWLFSRLHDVAPYGATLRDWAFGLGLDPGADLLELGCGPGRLAQELAISGYQVTGADRDARMIRTARRQGGAARFVFAEGNALPSADASFDATLAASLINVVPDPVALLGEMARVTRPGGVVSVFFPGPGFTPEIARASTVGLGPVDRVLFATWAGAARKHAPDSVAAWMRDARLATPDRTDYLGGALHAVTAQVSAAGARS